MNFLNFIKVGIFLGFKSIIRGNIGISVLTIMAMILIFINLLFVPSLIQGSINALNQQFRDTMISNILVSPTSGKQNIENVSDLKNKYSQIDGVKSVTSRYKAGTQIAYGSETNAWNVLAIDPSKDSDVFINDKNIVEGSYLSDDDEDSIFLGVQIAGVDDKNLVLYSTSLKTVHAGDFVTVTLFNGMKKDFKVKGIYNNHFVLSDQQAYISKKAFYKLFPSLANTDTNIYVKTLSGHEEQNIIEKMKDINPNFQFQKWQDLAGVIKEQTQTFEIINNILKTISLFVAAITIFIITYVDLVNKRKQIGIERAIGIRSASIVLSYVLKAIFYSLVGVFLAIIIMSFGVKPFVDAHPFQFPIGLVSLAIDEEIMRWNSLILILVASVSAFIPAVKSINMKIIDAIWGN